jgi:hypothetical protein
MIMQETSRVTTEATSVELSTRTRSVHSIISNTLEFPLGVCQVGTKTDYS